MSELGQRAKQILATIGDTDGLLPKLLHQRRFTSKEGIAHFIYSMTKNLSGQDRENARKMLAGIISDAKSIQAGGKI